MNDSEHEGTGLGFVGGDGPMKEFEAHPESDDAFYGALQWWADQCMTWRRDYNLIQEIGRDLIERKKILMRLKTRLEVEREFSGRPNPLLDRQLPGLPDVPLANNFRRGGDLGDRNN